MKLWTALCVAALSTIACGQLAVGAQAFATTATNGTVTPEYARKVASANAEADRQEAQAHQQKRAQARQALPALITEGRELAPPPSDQPDLQPSPKRAASAHYRGPLMMILAFILLGWLVIKMSRRHKEEAVVRQLAGKYIADGMEAVDVCMPDLLAETIRSIALPVSGMPDFPSSKAPARMASAGSFTSISGHVMNIRSAVQDFARATADDVRDKLLGQMHAETVWIKSNSGTWEYRPLHQVSSALDLLVQRLIEKKKDITPSSLRTIANTVDLLDELCVAGIRPDILTNPPVQILAVDDDPLCLRAVMFALEKASLHPDSATSGEQAISMAGENSYDVILMDIQMPGIDGLQACEQIRGTPLNGDTPVVFVTIQSDFHTRASSAAVGGTDFIGKPFLIFEITVKVLTFAARKRLQKVMQPAPAPADASPQVLESIS